MIIVPELKKVVILIPRTGSGSLWRTIRDTYPKSMLLYRHMEADGVPAGYDTWEKLAVIRHPTKRLWSLYNYLKIWDGGSIGADENETERIKSMTDGKSFKQFLLGNTEVFSKNWGDGSGQDRPILTRRNHIPDNKASQWFWARPDLGTTVVKYENIDQWIGMLNLKSVGYSVNQSKSPPLSEAHMDDEMVRHMLKYFKWDIDMYSQGYANARG